MSKTVLFYGNNSLL